MIRKAREEDIDALDNIYSHARRFMIENNNPEQWGNDHPSKEFILEKIRDGVQFVSENDKEIDGAFSFIIGEDETYQLIDDGEFIDSSLYGTIHSLAKKKGREHFFDDVISFALEKISHLRIDTHRDNSIMRKLIFEKNFIYCGIIYVLDHSPRLAYEYVTFERYLSLLKEKNIDIDANEAEKLYKQRIFPKNEQV